jgi:hypothetical protein
VASGIETAGRQSFPELILPQLRLPERRGGSGEELHS